MSDTLFDIPEQKSPRLLWIEKHGFLTHFNVDCEPPWIAIKPMEDHEGTIGEIMAEWCCLYDDNGLLGEGDTEIEALSDCAVKNNIPLWNQ